jgi:hypothetical protein
MRSEPIHVKETVALSRTLSALREVVRNNRVDILVDNRVLLDCWERQYSRSGNMLEALKELFWITFHCSFTASSSSCRTLLEQNQRHSMLISDEVSAIP